MRSWRLRVGTCARWPSCCDRRLIAPTLPLPCSTLVAAGAQLARLAPRLLKGLQDSRHDPSRFDLALHRAAAAFYVAQAGAALCRLLADAEASQAIQQSVALLLVCGRKLLLAAGTMPGGRAGPAAAVLAEQLRLMADFWVLGPAHMAGLAPPEELLPWLSAAVDLAATVTHPGEAACMRPWAAWQMCRSGVRRHWRRCTPCRCAHR
ncbi:hypothetical protein ABPG75_002768 [Micractinium tetrahymenae]